MTKAKAVATKSKSVMKSGAKRSAGGSASYRREDYKIRFFVADDIRVENDSKPMLIGFYSDNVVGLIVPKDVAPSKTKPLGLSGLSVMFTISAPIGDHVADLQFKISGSTTAGKLATQQFQITADKSSFNLIGRMQPFPVFEFGSQQLTLVVDGHEFVESFTFKRFNPV